MDELWDSTIPSSGIATSALVPLFAPYCGGLLDLGVLEQALDLLQQGSHAGLRALQGGESRVFELRWSGGLAPLELASCELRFPALPQVQYSFQVPAHHLLAWLAQAQASGAPHDLPDGFWRWLILGETADSAA